MLDAFKDTELGKEFEDRKRRMSAFNGWPQGKREQLLNNMLWLWTQVEEICAWKQAEECRRGNDADVPEIVTSKKRGRPAKVK